MMMMEFRSRRGLSQRVEADWLPAPSGKWRDTPLFALRGKCGCWNHGEVWYHCPEHIGCVLRSVVETVGGV